MDSAGSNSSSTANIVALLWLVSLVIVGAVAFFIGTTTATQPKDSQFAQISAQPTPGEGAQLTAPPQQQQQAQDPSLNEICKKSGPSQKKDYLIPYILKEGDSFATVAEKELEDGTRVSELTALNEDQKQLTVGSTIYLPPKEIKQSSGRLAEISGKVVKKDNANWQISYGGGTTGPGVLMPAFWFAELPEAQSVKLGDCVTVFIDNGVKAYSVKKSS